MSFLKRLISRDLPPGDLATGDWSPVPPSASAQPTDVVAWLKPAAKPVRPELEDEPLRPLEPVQRYMQHLSAEELAIIQEQQEAREHQQEPPTPTPEPEPVPEPQASPRPSRWVEVLSSYCEHLTDAELRIIRQQLASS
jgi:hypothetical protein